MFKRRFRLPSPAIVISMVALSLVLGGTAVAASTATHKDKKADTTLIKKLAPSLSVKHAKTADSATNATHATSADSATNATNATHAASADSATNATNATNATSATNATNATNATTASSATSPGTLAAGKTETGNYAVSYTAAAAGAWGNTSFSFPFPLAAAPTGVEWINVGGATDSHCPGSFANPQAAPGYFCVYAGHENNVSGDCIVDGSWVCDSANKYGTGLLVTATGAGNTVSTGTWAVTASTSGATVHNATNRVHSQRNTQHGDLPVGAH